MIQPGSNLKKDYPKQTVNWTSSETVETHHEVFPNVDEVNDRKSAAPRVMIMVPSKKDHFGHQVLSS